jgi:hypothetical protein
VVDMFLNPEKRAELDKLIMKQQNMSAHNFNKLNLEKVRTLRHFAEQKLSLR